ncbi:MAG: ATP-dependent DNA helicase RecG [Rikenellaceae bacterium]
MYLPTMGEKRAKLLGDELGIYTCEDLLYYTPFRYIDRTKFYTIAELQRGDISIDVQIKAYVQQVQMVGEGRGARLVITVYDGTGIAEMVWFQSSSWVLKSIDREREYIFFGKPSIFNGHLSMVHPEFEAKGLSDGVVGFGVQGVYHTTEKLRKSMLGTRVVSTLVRTLWNKIKGEIPETLPPWIISRCGLMSRSEALFQVHFPQSNETLARALYRLKFEELLIIQLNLLQSKAVRTERSVGYLFKSVGEKFNRFYNEVLPFDLTGAQKRVVREIRENTATGHQMNRLLQGDVGSGKTIVALLVALLGVDNGGQCAIMAPTEILAQQHYQSLAEMCEKIGVRVELLTGSTRKKKREEILPALKDGAVDILIGTHALIEDNVEFAALKMVIIDEQHRFGVMQRAKLHLKGGDVPPHILVMTATPIPRTLAMTLYGDLDVSIIDELPPGRKEIRTLSMREEQRLRVMGFMREEIAKGRQCYVVYPAIDENDKIDIASVEAGAAALLEFFPPEMGYTTVVVHGKMSAKLKDYGMERFKSGEAQILVATTVIEVGVNVPNATVMVIENAHRFGLSQLHQLRGRVGRGGEQSWCILLSGNKVGSDSRARLEAMVETTDGFVIAQRDMELRGAGDIEGTRQSGQAIDIKFADLARDGEILSRANALANEILGVDWLLSAAENFLLRVRIAQLRAAVSGGELDMDLSKIS